MGWCEPRAALLSTTHRPSAGAGLASRLDDLISTLPEITPAQMQWIIFMLLLFISSMEMLMQNRWKKQGTVRVAGSSCSGAVRQLGDMGLLAPACPASAWAAGAACMERAEGVNRG